MRFWDTSGLLSLILEQEATANLRAIISQDDAMVIWWGSKVEAASGVARLVRAAELSEPSASTLLRQIEAFAAGAYEVQPTEEVRSLACRLLRVHDLRAADSLQLAAAIVWADHRPAGLGIVTLDARLRTAADREGFAVTP